MFCLAFQNVRLYAMGMFCGPHCIGSVFIVKRGEGGEVALLCLKRAEKGSSLALYFKKVSSALSLVISCRKKNQEDLS
jgi:hypothetical protein